MSGLVVHDTGDGAAVLMLHAYPLDASQWDAQVAAFSDRYRCLRPDFWGCAGAPGHPGATIEGFAAEVLAAVDRLGVEGFAVVGSSMGGYAAFALLRAAPERVRAVVLAGTRAAADTAQARDDRAAVAESVRRQGVEAVVEPMTERLLCARCRHEVHIADPVRGRIRRWTPDGLVAVLAAIAARPDSTATLPAIAAPTLVAHGTDDVIVPLDEARAMAAAVRGAELVEFAGAAHLPNLEQPQAFSRRVGDFLDRHLQ